MNEPGAVEFGAVRPAVSSVKNHHGLNSNAVNISGCINHSGGLARFTIWFRGS